MLSTVDPGAALAEPQPLDAADGSQRPPLLFVHGAWAGAWVWHDHFVPWFGARGWECHTFDLRHHGDRGGPKTLRRTRIRDYVDDLAAEVAGLSRPPIIVAHSMGSLVAQRYLEERALPGAVLLAPIPLGGVWRATARSARRHPLKFLQANLIMDLRPAVDSPRTVRSMLVDHDADDATVKSIVERGGGESYLAYLDMLFVTRPRPALVHTPVAIIIGDRDRLFSVKEARKLASAYGVEATVLHDTAHHLTMGPRWERAAEATLAAVESL
jgi:pimeloyl-ACP methyl ester carboxylesterase